MRTLECGHIAPKSLIFDETGYCHKCDMIVDTLHYVINHTNRVTLLKLSPYA